MICYFVLVLLSVRITAAKGLNILRFKFGRLLCREGKWVLWLEAYQKSGRPSISPMFLHKLCPVRNLGVKRLCKAAVNAS